MVSDGQLCYGWSVLVRDDWFWLRMLSYGYGQLWLGMIHYSYCQLCYGWSVLVGIISFD